MSAVQVEAISKHFDTAVPREGGSRAGRLFGRRERRSVAAVRDISFAIEAGERVAFIGPNGAGKSTTLKMLSGILYPTSGHAVVAGYVPWQDRRALAYRIGIVFGQRSQLWFHLPARDSFLLLAKIYDIPRDVFERRLDALVDAFRIGHLIAQPVRQLSLGQRMRCEIVASLLHGPKIVFLDEPTIGLDVTAKAQLREHLKALSHQEDITVLLTSHDTGDIAEICERVIVINHGEKLLDQPLSELRQHYGRQKAITLATGEEAPEFAMDGVTVISSGRHQLQLGVDLAVASVDQVVASALGSLSVKDLAIEEARLDEVIKQIYADQDREAGDAQHNPG